MDLSTGQSTQGHSGQCVRRGRRIMSDDLVLVGPGPPTRYYGVHGALSLVVVIKSCTTAPRPSRCVHASVLRSPQTSTRSSYDDSFLQLRENTSGRVHWLSGTRGQCHDRGSRPAHVLVA